MAAKIQDPRIVPGARKKGRPPGSKTRADAPSKQAATQKKIAELKSQAEQLGLNVNAAPAAPAAPAPAVSLPDSDLFGATPDFARPAEHFAEGAPGPENDPETETEYIPPDDAKAAPEGNPESQRPLASMIWDSIVNALAVFIGNFWFPRKQGDNLQAGEIPYDEREMVIVAWCKYLHAVGMSILSPGQELGLAIANYCLPRLFATLAILKEKFGKKKKADFVPDPNDLRYAKPDENKPDTAK